MTRLGALVDGTRMNRRRALAWLGGLGLGAVAAGCADGSGSDAADAGADPEGADVCVLTPELTEGPYYLDLELVREDITEGRPGAALALRVTMVEAESCTPIENAAVDVWHCDAGGVYSGVESAGGETFLRGIQLTGADGVAEFRTIFPGWYTGRAVHVHAKVHLDGADTFTGQLFFDEATIAAVYEAEPYAARSAPDTPNGADGIFAGGGSATLVAVTSEGEGYAGAVTLGVARA